MADLFNTLKIYFESKEGYQVNEILGPELNHDDPTYVSNDWEIIVSYHTLLEGYEASSEVNEKLSALEKQIQKDLSLTPYESINEREDREGFTPASLCYQGESYPTTLQIMTTKDGSSRHIARLSGEYVEYVTISLLGLSNED